MATKKVEERKELTAFAEGDYCIYRDQVRRVVRVSPDKRVAVVQSIVPDEEGECLDVEAVPSRELFAVEDADVELVANSLEYDRRRMEEERIAMALIEFRISCLEEFLFTRGVSGKGSGKSKK